MKIEVTKDEAIILLNLVRKKRDKFREMNMNYQNKKEPNTEIVEKLKKISAEIVNEIK